MAQARHPSGRAGRGLTLIEIAVVVAMLAILATMAVPTLGDRLARQRLASAGEELALDMAEARHQAAQAGQALHLVFTPGSDWCYAVARSPGCGCAAPEACQIKVVHGSDHPGVTLASATNASFDPAAVALSAGGAELLGVHGRQALRVALSPLGRARLCSPSGLKGYGPC
jgi:type IV fimbrial biogenesis protein FimT